MAKKRSILVLALKLKMKLILKMYYAI